MFVFVRPRVVEFARQLVMTHDRVSLELVVCSTSSRGGRCGFQVQQAILQL